MKITVKVHPRSSARSFDEISPGNFEAHIPDPPAGNRANFAVIELVSEFFHRPVSAIRLVHGKTSRIKIFEVA